MNRLELFKELQNMKSPQDPSNANQQEIGQEFESLSPSPIAPPTPLGNMPEDSIESFSDTSAGPSVRDSFTSIGEQDIPISNANPLLKQFQEMRIPRSTDKTPGDTSSLSSRYKDAQDTERKDLSALAFLKAAQRDSKGSQGLLEQVAKNTRPYLTESVGAEGEQSARDFYRSELEKQSPGLNIPETTPSSVMQELLTIRAKQRGSSPFQQSQYMTKEGDPVIFDKASGTYKNVTNGETVKDSKGLIRNYVKTVKDPRTGEIIEVRPGQGVTGALTASPKEDGTGEPRKKSAQLYQSFNPEERAVVNDMAKTFYSETKAERQSLAKVDRVTKKAIDAITNPIAASQLGAEVATIFENGRLTDEDVLRYTRRLGITDRLEDALQSAMDGTINEEKAKLIQETLFKYSKESKRELGRRSENMARLASGRLNAQVSPEELAPLLYGGYERRIKVVLPDGQTGTIDPDKVEAFKQKYPDAEIQQ